MEAITTHPATAAAAKAFTAPGSLSFPGASDLNPPSVGNDKVAPVTNGPLGQTANNGTGVTPATPAVVQSGSGLTPTLQ